MDVLPLVVKTCEEHPGFADVEKVVVVRDLRGIVRLAIRPNDKPTINFVALEQGLAGKLGKWFAGPLLVPNLKTFPGGLGNLRAAVLKLPGTAWEPTWTNDLGERESGVSWSMAQGRAARLQARMAGHQAEAAVGTERGQAKDCDVLFVQGRGRQDHSARVGRVAACP